MLLYLMGMKGFPVFFFKQVILNRRGQIETLKVSAEELLKVKN